MAWASVSDALSASEEFPRKPLGVINRFFLTTVLGGRLHPNGIPEWGPWVASRLHWWPEDHLDSYTEEVAGSTPASPTIFITVTQKNGWRRRHMSFVGRISFHTSQWNCNRSKSNR